MPSRWRNKGQILPLSCLSVPSRSKWHRSWKTHTQSSWQDCTLSTRPSVTCWKTWGMDTSASHAHAYQLSSTANRTEEWAHWPDDLTSADGCLLWCSHSAQMDAAAWAQEVWHGKDKKRRRSIVIFNFRVKDKGSRKWRRNFLLPPSCSFFHSFFFCHVHPGSLSCFPSPSVPFLSR